MKKFLSMALALAMAAALAVPAFALEEVVVSNATSIAEAGVLASKDVTVTVTTGSSGPNKIVNRYYVTIEWATINPTYKTAGSSGTTYTWDGSAMKYQTSDADNATASSSTNGAISAKIYNRSDLAIKVSAAWEAKNGSGATWGGTGTEETVAAVDGTGDLDKAVALNGAEVADSAVHTKEFSGAVTLGSPFDPSTDVAVGTLTVTIKKAA